MCTPDYRHQAERLAASLDIFSLAHALFEVASDALKRAKSTTAKDVRDAVAASHLSTVVGPVKWGGAGPFSPDFLGVIDQRFHYEFDKRFHVVLPSWATRSAGAALPRRRRDPVRPPSLPVPLSSKCCAQNSRSTWAA